MTEGRSEGVFTYKTALVCVCGGGGVEGREGGNNFVLFTLTF